METEDPIQVPPHGTPQMEIIGLFKQLYKKGSLFLG